MKRLTPPLIRGKSQARDAGRAIQKICSLFSEGEVADETLNPLFRAERGIADGIAAQGISRAIRHLSGRQRYRIGIGVGNLININAEQFIS